MAVGLSKLCLFAGLFHPADGVGVLWADDRWHRWQHASHLRSTPNQAIAHVAPLQKFRQRLENRNDVQYYSRITLGGQQVDAIFDTGSFDVLVVSQKCKQCPRPQYDSSESATYHSLNATANHSFGSGDTTSHVGIDDFRVGPYHVEKQVIHEIVKHKIKVLDKASFDAIVGIGPKTAQTSCNMSLLCTLNISEFSVCLEREPGAPGWLTWGSPLNAVEKEGAVEFSNIGCAAIIDSGTSLIAAPSHSIIGLKALIPALASNCSNWNDMPDLEFTLNGRTLTLPREAYAMKLTGSMQDKLRAANFLQIEQPTFKMADVCFVSFIEMDRSTEFGPLWIFGMPFFREYHVTFGLNDNETKRKIWLNKASDTCTPEPLPNISRNESWTVVDAKVTGVRLYPSIAVVQKESRADTAPKVQRLRKPLEINAKDLLMNDLARLDKWKTMEVL